jgi:hypothetical protein
MPAATTVLMVRPEFMKLKREAKIPGVIRV